MTSHSLLSRLLLGLFFLCLALLFAGALMGFWVGDTILALRCVSWLAVTLGLLFFERLLALLAPGARVESRWTYTGLGFLLAPMFFQVGLTSLSDGLGLLLALAAFFFGLRAFENRRATDVICASIFTVLAISAQYSRAALLLPLGGFLGHFLWTRKKWLPILGAILFGGVALLPHFWLTAHWVENPLAHSSLTQWSATHFFKNTFVSSSGVISHYTLPNVLFLLFPLSHPAFCLPLPGLFFLYKKTDLVLPAKKILLASITAYLILLGGMPQQDLRHLLPVYALVLLVLFPAWDRLYCYGFLFFRRLTRGILVTALALQLFFCAKFLLPILFPE